MKRSHFNSINLFDIEMAVYVTCLMLLQQSWKYNIVTALVHFLILFYVVIIT